MRISPNDLNLGEAIDAMMQEAIAQRLIMPIGNFPAFKLGLIDSQGNIKRQPRSREEKRALTVADKVALMMKRFMSGKVGVVYNEYRINRTNPAFMRSLMKATSMNFNKYYNMTIGWDYRAVIQEEKQNRNKKREKKKIEAKDNTENLITEANEELEGE
jgi:hypothetical protein